MSTRVMINGELLSPEQATISVFDRGFLYGDSVFETVRTYGGVPFSLDEHLERLKRSATRVFIDLPVGVEQIADEVRSATVAANNPESYIRVIITRGSGTTLGLDPALAVRPSRVIIVGPLAPPPAEQYERGISVITFHAHRTTDSTAAAGAKVGNYLVAVLAMRQASEAGAAEALIVDGDGWVLEGASSNVFAIVEGGLVTPPETAGILPGITRAKILEVARAEGIAVALRPLPLADLLRADEVFVSSSIRELLPVVRVDGKPIGTGTPGPLARKLLLAFRENITKTEG